MEIEFDAAKNEHNIEKHGISLSRSADLEILALRADEPFVYGEDRFRAWGLIDGRYYGLAFTIRDGRVRAISLRLAHDKELARHVR